MTTVLEAARAYVRRGWAVTPVVYRDKRPILKEWETTRLAEADLADHFRGQVNLGVVLGETSGGLVDVDVDASEALLLAGRFLPPTGARFGRAGKPGSHWLYVVDLPGKTEQWRDVGGDASGVMRNASGVMRDASGVIRNPSGVMRDASPATRHMTLVELRATGGQTVFPPSVHPSGEAVTWRTTGEPARLAVGELRRCVGRLAAASLLARRWNRAGQRHEQALALGGGLLRAGWSVDEAQAFVLAVAEAPGDEEAGRRAADVVSTARTLAGGETAYGWPKLMELMGRGAVTTVCGWLGIASHASGVMRNASGVMREASSVMRNELRITDYASRMTDYASRMTDHASPLQVVRVADVAAEQVQWVWPGYIALRKLTMLDGDPGLGKSTVTLDLAARVSRGGPMPDGSVGAVGGPGRVLLLSAEDGVGDTIRPRLEAAGADIGQVLTLTGDRLPSLRGDLAELGRIVHAYDVRFVVVDPLMAFLDDGTNAYRDTDIRRILAPLAHLAEETGMALLVVRHLNKGAQGGALYRGGGSIGIIGQARSGLVVVSDPDDPTGERRILAPYKNNLGRLAASLAFRMAAARGAPRVEWLGAAKHMAAALFNPTGGERVSKLDEAIQFLRDALADGPRPAKEIEAEAAAQGIGQRGLKDARKLLGIRAQKGRDARHDGWMLSLPSVPLVPLVPLDPLDPLVLLERDGLEGQGVQEVQEVQEDQRVPTVPTVPTLPTLPADQEDAWTITF